MAVIAVFCTESTNLVALTYAGLVSGIDATIAGILVAFVSPIRPKFESQLFIDRVRETTRKMEKAIAGNSDIIHNTRFRALVTSPGGGVQLVQDYLVNLWA